MVTACQTEMAYGAALLVNDLFTEINIHDRLGDTGLHHFHIWVTDT